MYHLRVPVFLLAALVLLRCIAAAPSHRRSLFSLDSSSDDKQENGLADKESGSLPELISDPFLGLGGARPQRGLTAANSRPVLRSCKTSSCLKNWLEDVMSALSKGQIKKVDLITYFNG